MVQYKGKEHINYIRALTNSIWLQNNFKIRLEVCVIEALRQHREYLIRFDNNNKLKKTVKIPVPPHISSLIQMSPLND